MRTDRRRRKLPLVLDVAKVRALRKELGLTQQQAAQRSGLETRQRWNDIESGRRSDITITTLNRIAAALGVKAKDLLK